MNLTLRVLSLLSLVGAIVIPRLGWRRTAFGGFVALSLLYFPLRAGWPAAQLAPTACEWLVDRNLALYSINNTPHIILFALFFLLARRQVRVLGPGHRAWWGVNVRAFTTTLAMGALVELAEASAGAGHCRLRDLLPDAVGAMLGWTVSAVAMAAWGRWRPGLRRLRGRSNSSGGVT